MSLGKYRDVFVIINAHVYLGSGYLLMQVSLNIADEEYFALKRFF